MEIYIKDILESVVNLIRDTNIITSISKSGTTYIIYTPDTLDLVKDRYVTIGSNALLNVTYVDPGKKYFNVTSDITVAGTTWKANYPYFHWGIPQEVSQRLIEYSQSETLKYQKFPGIFYFLPTTQEIDESQEIDNISEIWLVFANYSQKEWVADDRLTYNFKPILIPLYRKFFDKLESKRNDYFWMQPSEKFTHSRIDHYFYGSPNANVINEYADAIEVQNLKLKFINNLNCCNL